MLKTALFIKPNLKYFSYLVDFPFGFGDGNFFKSFTSKSWACYYEVQICVVLLYAKFSF